MNILIISNLYPPNIAGGYEVLCHEVATALAKGGHKITVLTSCYGGRIARPTELTVHQALRLAVGTTIYKPFDGSDTHRQILNRDNAYALRRALDETQPDVIFCWNLYGLGRSFFDALLHANVPLSLMLTDNWLIEMLNPEFLGPYFERNVYGPPGREISVRANVTNCAARKLPASAIFGSVYMKDLHTAAGLAFARDSIIHNGVQQTAHANIAKRDRSNIGSDGDVRLLFAGRIVEIKGVHTAIEALAKLNSMAPSGRRFRLTIVGDARDTAYLARLRHLADLLGCADNVTYLPPVAQHQLPELFHEHDLYIFPSLYEPFSLTLIHAMAAGIPTIASRVGGNVEIIEEGETGLLFDRADSGGLAAAVIRACEDATLPLHIASKGSKRAQHFTSERMLERMQSHLRAAVA